MFSKFSPKVFIFFISYPPQGERHERFALRNNLGAGYTPQRHQAVDKGELYSPRSRDQYGTCSIKYYLIPCYKLSLPTLGNCPEMKIFH